MKKKKKIKEKRLAPFVPFPFLLRPQPNCAPESFPESSKFSVLCAAARARRQLSEGRKEGGRKGGRVREEKQSEAGDAMRVRRREGLARQPNSHVVGS